MSELSPDDFSIQLWAKIKDKFTHRAEHEGYDDDEIDCGIDAEVDFLIENFVNIFAGEKTSVFLNERLAYDLAERASFERGFDWAPMNPPPPKKLLIFSQEELS